MQNGFHTHDYNGVTSITDRHNHQYSGRTSSDPDVMGHTHSMEAFTAMNDGHTHYYRIQTGPAVYRNCGHYHYYQGDTDVTRMHVHSMNGYTSIE